MLTAPRLQSRDWEPVMYHLPRLSGPQAAIDRRLFRKRNPMNVQAGGQNVHILPAHLSTDTSFAVSVGLQVGGTATTLQMEQPLYDLLSGPLLEDLGGVELPQAAADLVTATALAPVTAWLENAVGMPVSIIDTAVPSPPNTDKTAGVILQASDGKQSLGFARLIFPASLTERILGLFDQYLPPQAESNDLIPVIGTCRLGTLTLPAAELATVQHGDLLLLPGKTDNDIPAKILIPHGCIHCNLGDGQATVVALRRKSEMDDTLTTSAPKTGQETEDIESPFDLSNLPVHVTFDLGDISVSTAILRDAKPGYVFEIDKSPTDSVTIRANGKRVGEGRLVALDDCLGVQVQRLVQTDE